MTGTCFEIGFKCGSFFLVSKAKYASTFHGLNFEVWRTSPHYVWQGGILDHLYCRYNAVPGGRCCAKCMCRTCFSPVLCRIALRRSASYGGHPSHAPFHSAYFFRGKKNLRIARLACHPQLQRRMVEYMGLEPMTSSLPARRSSQLS